MGFMDKIKVQATQAATQAAAVAKDTAQKGQAKVDQVQAKRTADGVLRQLGLAVYLQASERTSNTTDADIAKYVEQIKAYEDEYGKLTGDDAAS
jgi:hypothetical protein